MEVIEERIRFAKDLDAVTKRGEDMGLTDDEIAFPDARVSNDCAKKSMGGAKLKGIAAEWIIAQAGLLCAELGSGTDFGVGRRVRRSPYVAPPARAGMNDLPSDIEPPPQERHNPSTRPDTAGKVFGHPIWGGPPDRVDRTPEGSPGVGRGRGRKWSQWWGLNPRPTVYECKQR